MTATEDLFTPVHKGLRAMLYDLSRRLQTTDFADTEATRTLITDLEHDFDVARSAGCVLCVLNHHAEDEEATIFPPASKHEARLITELIQDHRELNRREFAIAASAHALLDLPSGAERVRAGVQLNQAANDLLAAYFRHMNREETDLVPSMKERFTNEEMGSLQGQIIGRMPPDRLFAILGWMLPALNATELTSLLGALRRTAPPPFVEKVVELAAARVDPSRWTEVRARVGL